jgi:hypothetical protein
MGSGSTLAAQGIAVVMWAYAKLGGESATMCKVAWALYPHVCAKLQRFSPQGLVMMCYALALTRLRHEPLLDVLTTQCRARMRSFNAQVCAPFAPLCSHTVLDNCSKDICCKVIWLP